MNEINIELKLDKILAQLSPVERVFVTGLIDKDPLTGVYNRRKFDRDLELVVAMAERTNKGTSLLMIDIDDFKEFNDKYGHLKGDQVLRDVSQCLEKNLRVYDKTHIYRYGGEEFVVIIPHIANKEAFIIGERLRKNVKATSDISISIGISHYKESSDTLQRLIYNADKALYEAKRKGKDKVVVFEKDA
jgi:diguanylate cyclase (GGDEF)-like protein